MTISRQIEWGRSRTPPSEPDWYTAGSLTTTPLGAWWWWCRGRVVRGVVLASRQSISHNRRRANAREEGGLLLPGWGCPGGVRRFKGPPSDQRGRPGGLGRCLRTRNPPYRITLTYRGLQQLGGHTVTGCGRVTV